MSQEKRVLIIENEKSQADWMKECVQQVADRKIAEGKIAGVYIESVLRNQVDEFKAWFDTRYPPGTEPGECWDILMLDIIFRKESLGGIELWKYLRDRDIDDEKHTQCIGELVVPTNSDQAAKKLQELGVAARVLAKNRARLIEVLTAIL